MTAASASFEVTGPCASGCPRVRPLRQKRTSRVANWHLFFPSNPCPAPDLLEAMGLPTDWGMSEEVKPIPEAYFAALWAARQSYRNYSLQHEWMPSYEIVEDPALGSPDWMRTHQQSMSSRWYEYGQALDSLLDDIEGRVRHSAQSLYSGARADFQPRRTFRTCFRSRPFAGGATAL